MRQSVDDVVQVCVLDRVVVQGRTQRMRPVGDLRQHHEVQQPLMADPQGFVSKSTQQFNSNGQPAKNPATTAPATSPTGTPKPNKQ